MQDNSNIVPNTAPFMAKNQEVDQVAVIREAECIGCTKCIKACPTDAIIGSNKQMHTVISDACSGCEACVTACPVDCIDLLTLATRSPTVKANKITAWQGRYQRQQQRRHRLMTTEAEQHTIPSVAERQSAIAAALQRSKAKKRGE